MKKLFSITCILFLMVIVSKAQYTQQLTTVREQAKIFTEATIKRDYKTVMQYTNLEGFPKGKLSKMTEERVLKILQTSDEQMVQQGREIKSIQIGDVLSIVKVGFEFQCTLEQITDTKMQYGSIISKTTLLAISEDNGKTWKFTDGTGRDLNDMRKIIPHLSDKLVFARTESPKLIKDPVIKKQP